MKSQRFFAFVFSALIFSCCAQAQIWESVRGNHHVTTADRQTEPFSGIKVSTGIDVYLTQGDKNAVQVEADENLHEYIRTEVKGGVLNVYSDKNIRDAERKRVYVTMKEITSLRTTSAGDIFGQTPINADNLEISTSSAGNIKIDVTAKNISVDISSAGDVTLKGKSDRLDADLSSAGDLKAENLETREADVKVSSAGDADVNVSEKLTARASSAGDINYYGNPRYLDAHASSAGGIHKR